MSPRAAAQLAALGFTHVYDYIAGKADWGSAGLPLEGDEGSETRAAAHARRDVPRCRLGDALQAVRAASAATGWDTCFVVDDDDVLLGRLGRKALRSADDVLVEAVMSEGPSTVRPSAPREPGRADGAAEPHELARNDRGRKTGRASASPRRRGRARPLSAQPVSRARFHSGATERWRFGKYQRSARPHPVR